MYDFRFTIYDWKVEIMKDFRFTIYNSILFSLGMLVSEVMILRPGL